MATTLSTQIKDALDSALCDDSKGKIIYDLLTPVDNVTAGTVSASKAVIVDSNKDISAFRNVVATNYDAGASGTAGTVDIYPTTASKGKLQLTCTDQTGNTTVIVTAGAMGQATTITIPDPGGATASVILTAGTQTMSGAKTFTGGITVTTTGVTVTDVNVALGTTTGTKIGTATSQKLGFWNATPVVQPVGAGQAALGSATTIGSNTGTAGAGLSLIGDTTAVNQAAALMNDLAALQEDIAAAFTLINQLRGDLVTVGIIKGAA